MKYTKFDGELYTKRVAFDKILIRAATIVLIVGIAIVSFILAHPVS
jgi:hypothetical protein